MANGENNIWGYGGGRRNRNPFDDDVDRRPGSDSESRAYSRKFDPRNEGEFSNLMEVPNQIELARIARERSDVELESLSAQKAVHFFPSVGKFIIPKENTWAAHFQLVQDNSQNLFFNPGKYLYFDKIVAEKIGLPALYDQSHPDYMKYEGLRTNLEVLRNDIIGIYLQDGSFDPGDESVIPLISAIATELGSALANDKWFKRPFTSWLSLDVANVIGVGAQQMYSYLHSLQNKPGVKHPVISAFRTSIGMQRHDWDLPPLEETPFSDAALAAPPPRAPEADCPPGLTPPAGDVPGQMAVISEGLMARAHKLRSVETLPEPERETSIEEARTILRWLRNLQFTDRDMEEWLSHGTPPEQLAKAGAIATLVEIYGNVLRQGAAGNPALMHMAAIQEGGDAAGAMAQGVLEHAMGLLPPGHPRLGALDALLVSVPDAWEYRQTQPVERLLSELETGIEYASGKAVGPLSPAEKLWHASQRAYANARRLHSVDALQPPAREESVEMAREILRKMKNLSFRDSTIKELVDTSRLEDKAEFAQKVDQMVESYRNLLAESAEANPNILDDPMIKGASQSAGILTYALSLMAAKEIPASIAAAQQISADITQMPQEWKQLHNHTVERLMASMEGGLEKAVEEIELAQEQQRDQEQEQQQVRETESSLLHAEHGRRKKRRRRRKQAGGSGLTKTAKRRTGGDLNGDGVLDVVQGLNLRGTDQGRIHLKGADDEAVKQIGGNLRAIGEQAQHLHIPQSQFTPPEEKPFIAREQDQKKNPHRPRDVGM